MFMNLDADVAHRLEATTMASFLEIYGEDVYDLLSDGHAPGTKRASLQASAGIWWRWCSVVRCCDAGDGGRCGRVPRVAWSERKEGLVT